MRGSHIYGPVPSRRLGVSLGVDLFETKTCNFNCIYCECGKNSHYVYERGHFVPPEKILEEIDEYLSKNPMPSSVTFSGSGEPTLSLDLGFLLRELHRRYPSLRLTVLTNGSLLWQEEVQEELLEADLVIPSLDAVTETAYLVIDRPFMKMFPLERVIAGIEGFSRHFRALPGKQLWIEVFLVPGVNDDDKHTQELARVLTQIQPHRVQLNTLDRPPAEEGVMPASEEKLHQIQKRLFDAGVICPVDVVTRSYQRSEVVTSHQSIELALVEVISRRPMRLEDLSMMLGIPSEEIVPYLDILQRKGQIKVAIQQGSFFYTKGE